MNIKTHKEQITAIHNWTQKQIDKVTVLQQANWKVSNSPEPLKVMLAAKKKAYIDVVSFIKSKYGEYLI